MFCEKPLATDLAEARAAIEADRRGTTLTVDYVMRWNPLYWLIRRLQAVRRSRRWRLLGRLRRFALENLAGDERLPADHWFWDRATSGGIFIEHGVHFFDAAAWLFGSRPRVVQALQPGRAERPTDTVLPTPCIRAADRQLLPRVRPSRRSRVPVGLLDWGFAHGVLRGWIPVELELEVWTDAEGARSSTACLDRPAAALAVPHVRPSGRERIERAT